MSPQSQVLAEAGTGQDAFNNMVDGGPEGEFYQDMVDYFYYSQLRAQGEMSTDTRSTDGRVPLEEIPNLMRALGYYPTERDIENMTSEVKYANYLVDGTVADSINFDDFVRLYINHRPVFGISKEQIQDAFATISNHCVQAFGRRARGSGEDAPKLLWNDLSELMKGGAEALTEDEFRSCLQSLLGEQEGAEVSGHIGPLSFADNVLGFADYEGGEEVDGGDMMESMEGKGSYEEKYD